MSPAKKTQKEKSQKSSSESIMQVNADVFTTQKQEVSEVKEESATPAPLYVSEKPPKIPAWPVAHRVDVIHVDTRWVGHIEVNRYAIRPLCESAGKNGVHTFCSVCDKEYRRVARLCDSEKEANKLASDWNERVKDPAIKIQQGMNFYSIGLER